MTTKSTKTVKSEPFHDEKQSRGRAVLGRLYWMFLGNILLIATAISIYNNPKGIGWADAFYLFIISSLIYIRYTDIKHWGGLTSTGEPASMRDWRNYSVLLVIIAMAVLITAHVPGLAD
ncbi:MAG: hypothetical protein A2Y07_05490 [Planctomycetes bacterium GWF2_50_10]|nr:MAG: hypothetical protein A2Y07_05490 [Planctomycetes bacterium GWF2_50_10]